jgi:general secretion pathway protein E
MVHLSERGIEARGPIAALLLGRDTVLLAEVGQVEARGRTVTLELIDGSQRRLALRGAPEAQELARRIDERLHPARRLLPTIRSAQDLRRVLHDAGAALPSALLELLLLGAARLGATDLHLERHGAGLGVRIRVDGMIHDLGQLDPAVAGPLLGRLKVISGLLTYRTDVIQEGGARLELDETSVSVRVTTTPGMGGEQAVVRLHDPAKATLELEELGFGDSVRAQLEAAARLRRGLVVIAGPPSSGKTTTLFALIRRLQHLQGAAVRVVSIEDPVEVDLPGVTQIQVEAARGNTYTALLRSTLRQDADVIVVGEMRDREIAHMVVQSSLRGHLVLTTVHAGNADEVVVRLRELGVDPATLESALRVVVAQRLVRRVCGSCAGAGCQRCSDTGFRGRTAVGEVASFVEGAGMAPITAEATALVERGVTTEAEVLRVLG